MYFSSSLGSSDAQIVRGAGNTYNILTDTTVVNCSAMCPPFTGAIPAAGPDSRSARRMRTRRSPACRESRVVTNLIQLNLLQLELDQPEVGVNRGLRRPVAREVDLRR